MTKNELIKTNNPISVKDGVGSPSPDFVFSLLPMGVLLLDKHGNVTLFNSHAEKILGKPKEEVLFQPFWIHFEDKKLGFSVREALRSKSPALTLRHKLEIKGLELRELEIEGKYLSTEEGSIPMEGLLVTIRDVTEAAKQDSKTERERRVEELGELAAMVAHEIRNPLGGIKGFASLLERDLQERTDLKKMAAYIIEGTNTINGIISRVLDYAKPIKTRFEPINLYQFMEEIRNQLLESGLNLKNTEIVLDCKTNPLHGMIDAHSLRLSMNNLLINAIQAMPSGGKATISLAEKGEEIEIIVSDTGTGITENNLKKIFSPFFTTRPDGNGFGLSEVHKTVQAHHGSIEVFSKEGMGAAFTIKLPKTQKQ